MWSYSLGRKHSHHAGHQMKYNTACFSGRGIVCNSANCCYHYLLAIIFQPGNLTCVCACVCGHVSVLITQRDNEIRGNAIGQCSCAYAFKTFPWKASGFLVIVQVTLIVSDLSLHADGTPHLWPLITIFLPLNATGRKCFCVVFKSGQWSHNLLS